MKRKEQRNLSVDIRAERTDDGPVIEGYAAIFDSPSEDMGFVEYIRKGAFTKTVQEADIRALWNHNDSYVLGRTKSGTLELEEDDRGLRVRIHPSDNDQTKYWMDAINRGDVDGMSFGFRTIKDGWSRDDEGRAIRELLEVALIEVSPVAFPAYSETSGELSVRSYLQQINEKEEKIKEIIATIEPGEPRQAPHSDEAEDRGDDYINTDEMQMRRNKLSLILSKA